MSQIKEFKALMDVRAVQVNAAIAAILQKYPDMHPRIAQAIRYSLEAPGKRLRAVLVLLCCELVSGKINPDSEAAACAIEMVHTYSLIHDDLPAMDDDDFRRGRPSCHKQFDEATAILTGDALLTLAFDVLGSFVSDSLKSSRLVVSLAEAAGASGMIAGQMGDLEAENKNGDLELLKYIHVNKTAKMFVAACRMGAISGDANQQQFDALSQYGLKIGLGFQIADDILDLSASSEELGKTAGKDVSQGKLTYPALLGLEKSRELAIQISAEAVNALAIFDEKADFLRQLAAALVDRTR